MTIATINVHLLESANELNSSRATTVIVTNLKEDYANLSLESDLVKFGLKLQKEDDLNALKFIATTLTPTLDQGSSLEFYVPVGDGSQRKIVLVALPTALSRDNSPARPHALTNVIKSVKYTGDLVVILNSATKDIAYAQACAVGRNFPIFTLKSTATNPTNTLHIIVNCKEKIESTFPTIVSNTIANIRSVQRLVDTPPNILHTDAYVEECRKVYSTLGGCSIQVIQGRDLEAAGFGGIWNVGKASEHLPALVVLSYSPSIAIPGTKSVCLVGKGITYDTGGLSIKTPTTSMAGMKEDMAGSAAVLGAFATLVSNDLYLSSQTDATGRLQKPLHALLCISENSVGPLSTRPDDVVTFLSGKTVEINNTDAEGRLVLADGCFFASRYLDPEVVVDIATLTGAQLIATGRNHAALYCSDEDLLAAAVRAGKISGDLTFPLPYCPEFYRNEFRSQVADMKNSVADRMNAQSSCAAQFIGNHLEEYLARGGKWLHVDMAGPSSVGERSTGYGVALLSTLVRILQP